MRYALTLSQPWATLVVAPHLALGRPIKGIESRGWYPPGCPPRFGRQLTLVVHAGLSVDRWSRSAILERRHRMMPLEFVEPYRSALIGCGYSIINPWTKDYLAEVDEDNRVRAANGHSRSLPLPLGALIGSVLVSDVVTGTDVIRRVARGEIDPVEERLGFYSERDGARFGWVLKNARLWSTPIAARGAQRVWRIKDAEYARMQSLGYVA